MVKKLLFAAILFSFGSVFGQSRDGASNIPQGHTPATLPTEPVNPNHQNGEASAPVIVSPNESGEVVKGDQSTQTHVPNPNDGHPPMPVDPNGSKSVKEPEVVTPETVAPSGDIVNP